MEKPRKPSPVRVCVVGGAGRMGRRLIGLIAGDNPLVLTSVLDTKEGLAALDTLGSDVIRTANAEEALADVDVAIDFSAPPACATMGPLCAATKTAYLVASTGLGDREEAALQSVSSETAVLVAPNLSIGINVLLELVEEATKLLGGFDVEISEIHHRHKRDAPSGTALALAQRACQSRPELENHLGRQGVGLRSDDELGVAALRGGDVPGEHTVFFFGAGERVEICHRAQTAEIFAHGAVRAAVWLAGKPAGRYSMRQVLGG